MTRFMELSARQLRTGIRSPAVLARQLRAEWVAPIDPDTPRSPQRPWIDASIRRYEQGGRQLAVLMADYAERTGRAKRRETAASEINNGKKMLERFARLDADEPAPSRFQLRPMPADVLGMVVSMGADLVYQTPEGHVVRQLITDSEITRPGHLRLYATAVALHFEERPGGGAVSRVEFWLLRYEDRSVTWTRSSLEASVSRLAVRLEEIARGAEGQAA
jgi:hypothetical protein